LRLPRIHPPCGEAEIILPRPALPQQQMGQLFLIISMILSHVRNKATLRENARMDLKKRYLNH
jgi:hypothetical protein